MIRVGMRMPVSVCVCSAVDPCTQSNTRERRIFVQELVDRYISTCEQMFLTSVEGYHCGDVLLPVWGDPSLGGPTNARVPVEASTEAWRLFVDITDPKGRPLLVLPED